MRKLILSIFLSSVLFFGISIAAHFDDVKNNHKNYTSIEYLESIGTLQGYPDGDYKPTKIINRAEMAKILVASQGINPDANEHNNCFSDVNDEWFAKYVCYAEEQNWVEGFATGNYMPGSIVSKSEALKMIIESFDLSDELPDTVNEQLFTDTNNTSWYAPYLALAKEKNLMEETSGNYFPASGATRAKIAEEIFRTLVVIETNSDTYTEANRDIFLGDDDEANGDENQNGNNNNDQNNNDQNNNGQNNDNNDNQDLTDLEIDMKAGNYFYDDDLITAKPGQTVKITFTEVSGSHNIVIDEIGLEQGIISGTLVTFIAPMQAGDYKFYCSVGNHEEMGMKGILRVAE